MVAGKGGASQKITADVDFSTLNKAITGVATHIGGLDAALGKLEKRLRDSGLNKMLGVGGKQQFDPKTGAPKESGYIQTFNDRIKISNERLQTFNRLLGLSAKAIEAETAWRWRSVAALGGRVPAGALRGAAQNIAQGPRAPRVQGEYQETGSRRGSKPKPIEETARYRRRRDEWGPTIAKSSADWQRERGWWPSVGQVQARGLTDRLAYLQERYNQNPSWANKKALDAHIERMGVPPGPSAPVHMQPGRHSATRRVSPEERYSREGMTSPNRAGRMPAALRRVMHEYTPGTPEYAAAMQYYNETGMAPRVGMFKAPKPSPLPAIGAGSPLGGRKYPQGLSRIIQTYGASSQQAQIAHQHWAVTGEVPQASWFREGQASRLRGVRPPPPPGKPPAPPSFREGPWGQLFGGSKVKGDSWYYGGAYARTNFGGLSAYARLPEGFGNIALAAGAAYYSLVRLTSVLKAIGTTAVRTINEASRLATVRQAYGQAGGSRLSISKDLSGATLGLLTAAEARDTLTPALAAGLPPELLSRVMPALSEIALSRGEANPKKFIESSITALIRAQGRSLLGMGIDLRGGMSKRPTTERREYIATRLEQIAGTFSGLQGNASTEIGRTRNLFVNRGQEMLADLGDNHTLRTGIRMFREIMGILVEGTKALDLKKVNFVETFLMGARAVALLTEKVAQLAQIIYQLPGTSQGVVSGAKGALAAGLGLAGVAAGVRGVGGFLDLRGDILSGLIKKGGTAVGGVGSGLIDHAALGALKGQATRAAIGKVGLSAVGRAIPYVGPAMLAYDAYSWWNRASRAAVQASPSQQHLLATQTAGNAYVENQTLYAQMEAARKKRRGEYTRAEIMVDQAVRPMEQDVAIQEGIRIRKEADLSLNKSTLAFQESLRGLSQKYGVTTDVMVSFFEMMEQKSRQAFNAALNLENYIRSVRGMGGTNRFRDKTDSELDQIIKAGTSTSSVGAGGRSADPGQGGSTALTKDAQDAALEKEKRRLGIIASVPDPDTGSGAPSGGGGGGKDTTPKLSLWEKRYRGYSKEGQRKIDAATRYFGDPMGGITPRLRKKTTYVMAAAETNELHSWVRSRAAARAVLVSKGASEGTLEAHDIETQDGVESIRFKYSQATVARNEALASGMGTRQEESLTALTSGMGARYAARQGEYQSWWAGEEGRRGLGFRQQRLSLIGMKQGRGERSAELDLAEARMRLQTLGDKKRDAISRGLGASDLPSNLEFAEAELAVQEAWKNLQEVNKTYMTTFFESFENSLRDGFAGLTDNLLTGDLKGFGKGAERLVRGNVSRFLGDQLFGEPDKESGERSGGLFGGLMDVVGGLGGVLGGGRRAGNYKYIDNMASYRQVRHVQRKNRVDQVAGIREGFDSGAPTGNSTLSSGAGLTSSLSGAIGMGAAEGSAAMAASTALAWVGVALAIGSMIFGNQRKSPPPQTVLKTWETNPATFTERPYSTLPLGLAARGAYGYMGSSPMGRGGAGITFIYNDSSVAGHDAGQLRSWVDRAVGDALDEAWGRGYYRGS